MMRFAMFATVPSPALRVLALLALAAGLSAKDARLKLGKTIPGDLSEGQTNSYSIRLKANQYLRALVTQPSPAVVVELYVPNGKKVLEVDTRNFRGKPTRVVWITEVAGEYRIRVNGAGHYEIKLQERRMVGPDDSKR